MERLQSQLSRGTTAPPSEPCPPASPCFLHTLDKSRRKGPSCHITRRRLTARISTQALTGIFTIRRQHSRAASRSYPVFVSPSSTASVQHSHLRSWHSCLASLLLLTSRLSSTSYTGPPAPAERYNLCASPVFRYTTPIGPTRRKPWPKFGRKTSLFDMYVSYRLSSHWPASSVFALRDGQDGVRPQRKARDPPEW